MSLNRTCDNCRNYKENLGWGEVNPNCVHCHIHDLWKPRLKPPTAEQSEATRREELAGSAEGRKDDCGKDPWALAPWDAFAAIVKVLKFGASKYDARNWEKGMDWDRPFSALMRHMTAWWEGERVDPESKLPHLWHAGCCIVFLIAYELRGIGKDTRPHIPR